MDSEEWYKGFRKRFNPESNETIQKLYPGGAAISNDKKWTSLMAEMLSEFAKDSGYEVNAEESTFGKKRFDMKWEHQRSHEEVFIEHECNPRGIYRGELPKLLNAGGKLRILMTYLPSSDFPGESIVEKIRSELRSKKAGDNFEFLLVLGTYSMESPTDWIGYSFFPTYDARPLIVPSVITGDAAKKAWQTRRARMDAGKASNTRK